MKTETFYRKLGCPAQGKQEQVSLSRPDLYSDLERLPGSEWFTPPLSGSGGRVPGPGTDIDRRNDLILRYLRDARANVKCAECRVSGHGGFRET